MQRKAGGSTNVEPVPSGPRRICQIPGTKARPFPHGTSHPQAWHQPHLPGDSPCILSQKGCSISLYFQP